MIVNVYALTQDHPEDQVNFIDHLEDQIVMLKPGNILSGRDLNLCLTQGLDKNKQLQVLTPNAEGARYRVKIKALAENLRQGIKIQDKVKILEIWYANVRSQDQHMDCNFSPQVSKMRAICSSWSNRNLSLKGKVTVLISSLIQYMVMNTVTPPAVIKEVSKLAFAFILEERSRRWHTAP